VQKLRMKGSSGLRLCPPRDGIFDWRNDIFREGLPWKQSRDSEVREQQEAEEAS